MSRRLVISALSVVALGLLSSCSSPGDSSSAPSDNPSSSGNSEPTITDIVGRQVSFDHAPEKVILGEGRSLFATSALDKEHPLDKVVAIGTDLKSNVPDYYDQFAQKIPTVKDLPEIGGFQKGDVTAENLLSFNADVLVLSQDQYEAAQSTGMTEQLDNLGLKYVVTDFRSHPLENTPKSMEIFGQLFSKKEAANNFNEDWQRVVDLVKERAQSLGDKDTRPTTFVWRAAGLSDCCGTWNNSNISELVNVAGGHNVGDDVIDGESGNLTPEKVIDLNPDVVIATGGDWSAKKDKNGNPAQFAAAGYQISQEEATESLKNLPKVQPGFDLLKAPKDHRLYALWHQFYNSPFNYLALLQIAQWLHPDQYQDIDIAKEWADAHDKYSAISGEGAFFVSTDGSSKHE